MVDFEQLHKSFEKKETDLSKLQKEVGFSRYILVRSLGSEHIQELLMSFNIEPDSNNQVALYKQLYNSNIDNSSIIAYIRKTYPLIRAQRKEEEAHLPDILKNSGVFSVVLEMIT